MKKFDQILFGFIVVGLLIVSHDGRAAEASPDLVFNDNEAETVVVASQDELPGAIPRAFQGFAPVSND